jgi:hypothetical protein
MFWPELNVHHYRSRLSEEKQTAMDDRASKLFNRAMRNHVLEASEFNWEADAWHDVFGLIRGDDTFRMYSLAIKFYQKGLTSISGTSDHTNSSKRMHITTWLLKDVSLMLLWV